MFQEYKNSIVNKKLFFKSLQVKLNFVYIYIYIQDYKTDIEIFIPDLTQAPNCDLIEGLANIEAINNNVDNNKNASSEASGQINRVPIKKNQIVVRQCRNKYKLLSQRTETIRDLKNVDSSANQEKATPYLENYRKRRNRIINKRVK